ncbi:MAG: hypothetical protein DRI88_00235 [Bacteroidetes bacterium]|nr:MAG: hypothetical protein DRI72_00880 [Bacteroidota bacterium]RLD49437.1 MAG: hypothetical protein DRI88_00235 [Bacteroidota bacterium]RLD74473.1 MAG: hypothetical protein DRI87_00900 [Bacteroidota bacterium]RLD88341.1 MAG: hypothetical protein DRJ02_04150 [Bacteroidota bacterium]HHL57713.1 HypC/HybG/HupF family hydrogenase formation chaperone [Bacteroidota bacterium]
MCLSIPARIDKINEDTAICTVGATSYQASLELLKDEQVEVGDYVLIHTGFAIQKLDAEEAEASLKTFDEFRTLNKQMDTEEQKTNKRLI